MTEKISQKGADELTYKILSIVRRKAEAGDASAQATIYGAMLYCNWGYGVASLSPMMN